MNLNFSVSKASDNTSITLTDTTPDWEVGGIQDVYDNGAATITPVILGVTYDPIDVKAYFDGGNQSNLIFVLTPDMFKISGVAQFTTTILDGDYAMTYAANHSVGGSISDSHADTSYVLGLVTKGVADEMQVAKLNEWSFDNTLREANLIGSWYTYLKTIEEAGEDGEVTDFRSGLENLQVMLNNRTY